MYVNVRLNGQVHMLTDLSKKMRVEDLRKRVAEKTGVAPDRQRLFFKGKQLEDGYALFDYDVQINSYIELAERIVIVAAEGEEKGEKEKEKRDDEESVTKDELSEEETIKLQDIFDGDPDDLNEPECKNCNDDPKKKCGECGCAICQGKENPAELLLCDECEFFYHLQCLDPPLDKIPDDDWYCPTCKIDSDEIVIPGAKLKARKSKTKMPSQLSKSKRDWGTGMATAGRSKICTKVAPNHVGPIPGVEVGMTWKFRLQVSEEGVHRPHVAGISGTASKGAHSIVLAGGYEDDVDHGDEFFYTGCGGRDLSGNKRINVQSFDQELSKYNLAIAVSCFAGVDSKNGADAGDNWRKGKPIRVVRSDKMKKHHPEFAPEEGCRYDGIYKVVRYWPERGKSGFLVWRYLFRRDDQSPAPWTAKGKEICKKNGYSCIFPAGYLESQKEKLKKTNKKKDEKKEEYVAVTAPPSKKLKISYKIEDDIRALIATEKQNQKIWDLIMESQMTTKLEFTNLVEEYFKCIVCQDLIFQPVTTPCGHNFCQECYKSILEKSETKACPSCRETLQPENGMVNKILAEILAQIFPGYRRER